MEETAATKKPRLRPGAHSHSDKRKLRTQYITPNSIVRFMMKSIMGTKFTSPEALQNLVYSDRDDYIDLSIIRRQLEEGLYKDNNKRFVLDMRKVWTDALGYFPEKSLEHEYARCLLQDFEKYWQKYQIAHDPMRKLEERLEKLERQVIEARKRLEEQENSTYEVLSPKQATRLTINIQRLSPDSRTELIELIHQYVHQQSNGTFVYNFSHMLQRDYHTLKDFLWDHKEETRVAHLNPNPQVFLLPSTFKLGTQSSSEDSEEDSSSEEFMQLSEVDERVMAPALPPN